MNRNHIGELRRKKGLTQKEFGRLLHVSGPAVSGYETGRIEPSISTLFNMMRVLECTFYDMYEGEQT